MTRPPRKNINCISTLSSRVLEKSNFKATKIKLPFERQYVIISLEDSFITGRNITSSYTFYDNSQQVTVLCLQHAHYSSNRNRLLQFIKCRKQHKVFFICWVSKSSYSNNIHIYGVLIYDKEMEQINELRLYSDRYESERTTQTYKGQSRCIYIDASDITQLVLKKKPQFCII